MNRLPVAGFSAPSRWIPGLGLLVEGVPSVKDGGIVSGMAFSRCHEADRAVAALVDIPADESVYPVARCDQVSKAVDWVAGYVLAGTEQGLRIGVVVTDPRPTEGSLDIHVTELFQERRRLEHAAVIGMQYQHLLSHMLCQNRPFKHASRVVGRLAQEDLPTNSLAAEDVDDHYQIVVDALDRSREPRVRVEPQKPSRRKPARVLRPDPYAKLPMTQRGIYLSVYVVMDLLSHYVVAWMLSRKENSSLAQRLMSEAVERYEIAPEQLTVHQDRGSPMTATSFLECLADRKVVASHSRTRVSNGNAFSEGQFKTAKYQPDYPGKFPSFEQART
jgi:hypothetical protein